MSDPKDIVSLRRYQYVRILKRIADLEAFQRQVESQGYQDNPDD